MNNCIHWEMPTHPEHIKCRHRVIAGETPAYKGTPICVSPNRSLMRCIKEHEYSVRIAADIYQELPGYTCEHCGVTYYNNYPCDCRVASQRMGTNPPLQRVSDVIVNLNNEIEDLVQVLEGSREEVERFGTAIERTHDVSLAETPITFRTHIEGHWVHPEHTPPDNMESMNPINCTKFDANEFGNCKNLSWCFRVFGIQLQCQQTRKEVIPKPMKEHRRLEVE